MTGEGVRSWDRNGEDGTAADRNRVRIGRLQTRWSDYRVDWVELRVAGTQAGHTPG